MEYKQIESPTVHGKPTSRISTAQYVDESGDRKRVTIKHRVEADKINFKTCTNNNLAGEGKQVGTGPHSNCSQLTPLAAQTSVANKFPTNKVSGSEVQRIFKERLQSNNEQKNLQEMRKLKIKEAVLRLEQITKRAIDHNLASQKRITRQQRQRGDKMGDAASIKNLTAPVEQEPSFADFNGSDKSAISFSRIFNASTQSKKLEKSSSPIFEKAPTAVQYQPKPPLRAEKSEFQRSIKNSPNLSKGPDHSLPPDSFTPRKTELHSIQNPIDPRKPRIPKITEKNSADPLNMINLVSRNLARGLQRNSSDSVPILPETVERNHQLMPEILQPKSKNHIIENAGLTGQATIPTADKPTRTEDTPKSFHFKKTGQTRLRKWYAGLIRPRARPLIVLQKAVKENDRATSALERYK